MMTSVINGGEVISILKNHFEEGVSISVDGSTSGCDIEVCYMEKFKKYRFQVVKTNGKQDDKKNNVIAEWWMD